MGIEATLKRVSPGLLSVLRGNADATQVFALMQNRETTRRPSMTGPMDAALRERLKALDQQNTGSWLLAEGLKRQPARYALIAPHLAEFQSEWSDPGLDLHKSWHVLHYVLCGSRNADDQPLSWAILGVEEVAPGLDDPPVKYVPAEQVVEIASACERVDFATLEATRRDHLAGGVYRWEQGPKDWLAPCFEALRTYYDEAAANRMAMLMWRG